MAAMQQRIAAIFLFIAIPLVAQQPKSIGTVTLFGRNSSAPTTPCPSPRTEPSSTGANTADSVLATAPLAAEPRPGACAPGAGGGTRSSAGSCSATPPPTG